LDRVQLEGVSMKKFFGRETLLNPLIWKEFNFDEGGRAKTF